MRKNPQSDSATRRIKRDAIRGISERLTKIDPRNLGVATRLVMPEVVQKESIELQNSDGEFYFVSDYSRSDGADVSF